MKHHDGTIWSRCEVCGERFNKLDDGVLIDGSCAEVLEGTPQQYAYCCEKCANEDGWHLTADLNNIYWKREYRVQNWSQEEGTYQGTRSVKQKLAVLTVEDVLLAMYEVNVPLTDENLDAVLDELNGYLFMESHDDLQSFIENAINGRS